MYRRYDTFYASMHRSSLDLGTRVVPTCTRIQATKQQIARLTAHLYAYIFMHTCTSNVHFGHIWTSIFFIIFTFYFFTYSMLGGTLPLSLLKMHTVPSKVHSHVPGTCVLLFVLFEHANFQIHTAETGEESTNCATLLHAVGTYFEYRVEHAC